VKVIADIIKKKNLSATVRETLDDNDDTTEMKGWDDIEGGEAPNYNAIRELVQAVSIFLDGHSELVCKENSQKPVGFALVSCRNNN
jgi:hypothetical protein